MNFDTLRVYRNILLRSFVIGFAITLVLGIVTMLGWTSWMSLATSWFHTDEATLTPLVLKMFVDIRFFLLFVVLTPGLAMHWTLKKEFSNKS